MFDENNPERDVDSASDRGPGESTYDVGYGKPPKKTQFKKGVSGNPAGRPKKKPVTDFRLLLDEILAEEVKVRGPDGIRTMTKFEAMFHAQRMKALNGDHKAIIAVAKLSQRAGLFSVASKYEGIRTGVVEVPFDGELGLILGAYRADKTARLAATELAESNGAATKAEGGSDV